MQSTTLAWALLAGMVLGTSSLLLLWLHAIYTSPTRARSVGLLTTAPVHKLRLALAAAAHVATVACLVGLLALAHIEQPPVFADTAFVGSMLLLFTVAVVGMFVALGRTLMAESAVCNFV